MSWNSHTKCSLQKPFSESHQGVSVFWAWSACSLCLPPCNKCCTFLYHNLVSAYWLYSTAELNQVGFGNSMQMFLEVRFLRVDMLGQSCAHTHVNILWNKRHTQEGVQVKRESRRWSVDGLSVDFLVWYCTTVLHKVITGGIWAKLQEISLYYFLQLHVNL